MSLNKAIESGKEKRRQYRGSKAVDQSCRDNSCPWCKGNVEHKHKRRMPAAGYQRAHENLLGDLELFIL